MASSFPGAIDSFTDPLSGSPLNSPSHSAQHADLNDAAEKIETYMGLVKVIPTSVAGSGVTLGATGTVTFAASTSVSINGCFSALYSNYRVVIAGSGTDNLDGSLRFRAGGTDSTGANYQYASSGFYGGIRNDASGTGQTSIGFAVSFGNGRTSGASIDIYRPFTTDSYKVTSTQVAFAHSAVGVIVRNVAGALGSATQFDGFTFFVGSGSISGTVTVYGYRI
jgi:hypothetical protein